MRRHLQNCKYQRRGDSSLALSQEQTGQPRTSKRSLSAAGASDGGRHQKRKAGGEGNGVPRDETLIEDLTGMYMARIEALETKERECRRERASLEDLAAFIRDLEGKRDAERRGVTQLV